MLKRWPQLLVSLYVILMFSAGLMEIAGAEPVEKPEAKPTLGAFLLLTDTLMAEKNNKPGEWIRNAVEEKIPAGKYQFIESVTPNDFIAFMSKKDIQPDSNGLFKELRLATFVEYGRQKNTDFILAVIGDATVTSHMATKFNHYTNPETKVTTTTSYEELVIDFADVRLRAVMVDIKKSEYIFNTILTKRSDGPDLFANQVRSVINNGTKKAVAEFNQKVVIP